MKKDLHPAEYRTVIFEDTSSGARFLIGSTIDTEKTDINAGIFASKDGYSSQWFTPQLRANLKKKLDGTVLAEIRAPQFTVIHVTYSARGAE